MEKFFRNSFLFQLLKTPLSLVLGFASLLSATAPVMGAPDPLKTSDGRVVDSAEMWKRDRVPELRKLFQTEMYGMMPEKPGSMEVKVLHEDKAWLEGRATLREMEVHLTGPETKARLLLVVPNQRQGPVATFLGMNFKGNHALLADESLAIPPGMVEKDALRATDKGWPIEAIVGRGYGFATFYSGDFVRDQSEIALARVKEFSAPAGTSAESAPATLACWAWGFSRMVDVLEKQPEIDAKRIAVVGHSRNGKASLFAAAMDERIALAIPTQAGCGGTAPSRLPEQALDPKNGRPAHETVEIITSKFPHWFCGKFNAVGKNAERLEFDQHELVALCAPRPVLFSCAVSDLWSNPEGQFEMLLAADPVYRLVAGDGIGARQMPEVGKLMPSRLGYFIRPGGHSMNETDWLAWLDYADVWLKAKP